MRASDPQSLSRERYSRFAAAYVTSVTHASGPDLAHLLQMAQPEAHWQVLDIATGGGHTALTFAPHVASVVASDLTPAMLEQAAAHVRAQNIHNVSYREAAATGLPFADESFDLVTCRIAAHHFPDAQRFVHESARVLRPGGLLLLQDQMLPAHRPSAIWIDNFERLRDPSHNCAYSETAGAQCSPAPGCAWSRTRSPSSVTTCRTGRGVRATTTTPSRASRRCCATRRHRPRSGPRRKTSAARQATSSSASYNCRAASQQTRIAPDERPGRKPA